MWSSIDPSLYIVLVTNIELSERLIWIVNFFTLSEGAVIG